MLSALPQALSGKRQAVLRPTRETSRATVGGKGHALRSGIAGVGLKVTCSVTEKKVFVDSCLVLSGYFCVFSIIFV